MTERGAQSGLCSWDGGLYAIIDSDHVVDGDPLRFAEKLLKRGCSVLQLRDKRLGDRAVLQLASALKERCKEAGVPFVVNDRPDLAVLSEADGLHLGQNDMRVRDARRILGSTPIGVSTHSLRQALEAESDGADLIGFGPVFPTQTKDNPDPVVGLEKLAEVCEAVSIPVVAIGGIDAENASSVLLEGARWVAAISALESLSSAWPQLSG